MRSYFREGLRGGVPIALGYFSSAISFGLLAVSAGLTIPQAVLISLTNLTSAGQVAGVGVIAAGGSLIEMALTEFVINLRYCIMGISLSQKLAPGFRTPYRLTAAHGITDEIFVVCSAYPGQLAPQYMYGVTLMAMLGWGGGTLVGAAMGELLPAVLTDALGLMLYGMFIAVFVPAARAEKGTLAVVVLAAAVSIALQYGVPAVSSGFAVIICAVTAAALGAWLFPVREEEEVEAA